MVAQNALPFEPALCGLFFVRMDHELLPEDFQTRTWRRLTQAVSREIDRLRESNDSPIHNGKKTAEIRGRISALKTIRDLAPANSRDSAAPHNWLDPEVELMSGERMNDR